MKAIEWYRARTASSVIRKAIDESGWNNLLSEHSSSGADVVDASGHVASSKLPKPAQAMLESPEPIKPEHENLSGFSPKLVMNFGKFIDRQDPSSYYDSATLMMKPYHQRTSMGYNLPIYGWSTMATKAVFDAAGIGHMSEDVYAGQHDGVPVTYHIFAPRDYQTVGQMLHDNVKFAPSAEDVGKIAAMDYLTNNVDRHRYNLLVGPYDKDAAANKMVAIDHERNFQYAVSMPRHTHMGDEWFDLPVHYLKYSTLGHAMEEASKYGVDAGQLNKKLKAWWKDRSRQIRSAVSAHASAIRDENVRKHILSNFNARADALDKWTQDDSDLFHEHFPHPVHVYPYRAQYNTAEKIKEIVHGKEPAVAVRAIARVLKDKPDMSIAVSDTLRGLASQMTPEQIADVLVDNRDNKDWNAAGDLLWSQPRQKMLDVIGLIEDRTKKFKDIERTMPFLQAVRDRIQQGLDPLGQDRTEAA
jgi:hypothetical protein